MADEPKKRAATVSVSLFKKKETDDVKNKPKKEKDSERSKKEKEKEKKPKEKGRDRSRERGRDGDKDKGTDGKSKEIKESRERDKSREKERPRASTTQPKEKEEKPKGVESERQEVPLVKQVSVPALSKIPTVSQSALPPAPSPISPSPLSPSASSSSTPAPATTQPKEKKSFFKGGDNNKPSSGGVKGKGNNEYDSVDVAFFGASKETIGRTTGGDARERSKTSSSSFFGGKPKGRDLEHNNSNNDSLKRNPKRLSVSVEDVDAKFFGSTPSVKNERSNSSRRIPPNGGASASTSTASRAGGGGGKDVSGSVKAEFSKPIKTSITTEPADEGEDVEEYDILNDNFPTIKKRPTATDGGGGANEDEEEEYDIINGSPPPDLPPTLPIPTLTSFAGGLSPRHHSKSKSPRSPRPGAEEGDEEYDLLRDSPAVSPRPKSPRSKSPQKSSKPKSPRPKSPRPKSPRPTAEEVEDEEYDILRDDEDDTSGVSRSPSAAIIEEDDGEYDLLRDDDDEPQATLTIQTNIKVQPLSSIPKPRSPRPQQQEDEEEEEYDILVSPRPAKSPRSPRSPRYPPPVISPRGMRGYSEPPKKMNDKALKLSPRPMDDAGEDDNSKPLISPKRKPLRKSDSAKNVEQSQPHHAATVGKSKAKPLDERELRKRELARDQERAEQREREETPSGVVAFISSRSYAATLPESDLEKEIDKFLYMVTNRPPVNLLVEKGIFIDDAPKPPPVSPRTVEEEVVVAPTPAPEETAVAPASPRKPPVSPRGVVALEPIAPPEPPKAQVTTADGRTVTSKRQTTRKLPANSGSKPADLVIPEVPEDEDGLAGIKVDPLFATRRRYRHMHNQTGEPEVNLDQPGMEGNYKVGWSHGFDPLFASGAMIQEMGKDNAGLSTTVG